MAVDPVRIAVAAAARVGESPFWHPGEQALYYCDIPACRLQRYEPKGGDLRHWAFDSEVASCAPRRGGGLLIAMRDGLWHFDPASGERSRIQAPVYDPANERYNDGKCDPQGRFWVGTRYEPREPPLATLNCWADGALKRRAGGMVNVNGLGWSPDGRTMYWSDTRVHTVYTAAFEPGSGELGPRRELAQFPKKGDAQPLDRYGGRPDGAAIDSEGCYWVAMFEGRRVLRLSPTGEVLREVLLPVRCPTMPCFGGADLRTLYITTAREHRPPSELAAEPYAGCVLALDVEVPGLPVNFAL